MPFTEIYKGGLSLKTLDHTQQMKTPHYHQLLLTSSVG